METRTYAEAVDKLNTLQSNAATIEAIRASGKPNNDATIIEMAEYLKRIGYEPEDLNKLNVVHVTGTKGKGSTCAFVDSVLRHVKPNWKTGLYTSPHLVAVRERIRVNGLPISEEVFAKYFFEVWDRLEANPERANPATSPKPMYFRYMTLMAFHAFLSLGVNATILEVGIGGLYDCTNVVPKPLAAGVASLGIDHVFILGNTLGQIAWQKGGIFKEGVPAFTVPQPEEGMEGLRKQAVDRKASSLSVVPVLPQVAELDLGLSGVHQKQNASLALSLAQAAIEGTGDKDANLLELPLSATVKTALEKAKWPGRCQVVPDPKDSKTTWFLDGAHTVESLTACMQWYADTGVGLRQFQPIRILIFNCTNGRSGQTLLGALLSTAVIQIKKHEQGDALPKDGFFDHVIFCTNVTYADGHFKGDLTSKVLSDTGVSSLKTQQELSQAWMSLVPLFSEENIHVLPSVQHAVDLARGLQVPQGTEKDVLVAGSLHLVGGAIEVAGLSETVFSA
ncbi:FolC bifunctional protein [Dacryopinax primogenitus]|uniref:Folylpolyglutamate synthase n=1 Tax=Dacryopinax primogenitus (strain DJM 731) TaxID=1858805 RepID=M5GFL6_DACPD|nr:FolC bifunctional protein [Dacryopinax primogenitus]EJU06427.1 FolC bifunctional protein [Dacryopinax primogenitus]